jgi:hypothetical protein
MRLQIALVASFWAVTGFAQETATLRTELILAQIPEETLSVAAWYEPFGVAVGETEYYENTEDGRRRIGGYWADVFYGRIRPVAGELALRQTFAVGFHEYEELKFIFADIQIGFEAPWSTSSAFRSGAGAGYRKNFGRYTQTRHVGSIDVPFALIYPYVSLVSYEY